MDVLSDIMGYEPVGFVQSSHVFHFFSVKVDSLNGKLPQINYNQLLENPDLFYSSLLGASSELCLHVQCQLLDSQGNQLSLPAHTPHKHFSSPPNNIFSWNSWLELPVRYCDLPDDTQVQFLLLDIGSIDDNNHKVTRGTKSAAASINSASWLKGKKVIGTATTKLFRKTGCLKTGSYDLKVQLCDQVFGSSAENKKVLNKENQSDQLDMTESGFGQLDGSDSDHGQQEEEYPNPQHIRKTLKKAARDELEKSNDFLDRVAFSEAHNFIHNDCTKTQALYLNVHFPKFTHPNPQLKSLNIEIKYCELFETCHEKNSQQYEMNSVKGRVFDPDLDKPNMIEEKHRRLMIGGRRGQHADLKPDSATRNKLYEVLCKPLTERLTEDERNLVWQYRYSLSSYQNALVKFLRSVEWDNSEERTEAVKMMESKWAVPRIQDVLELLSEDFSSSLKLPCRQYAVKQLYNLPEGDLRLFLLQIVQALRFEDSDAIDRKKKLATISIGLESSSSCEKTDRHSSQSSVDEEANIGYYAQQERESLEREEGGTKGRADLAEFLVVAASKSLSVALDLNWYLEVESHDDKTEDRIRKIFKSVKLYLEHYLKLLSESRRNKVASQNGGSVRSSTDRKESVAANCAVTAEAMRSQMTFVKYLTEHMCQAREKGKNREERERLLREALRHPVVATTSVVSLVTGALTGAGVGTGGGGVAGSGDLVPVASSGTASGANAIGVGATELFNFHCFPCAFPHPVDSQVMVYGVDVNGIRLFKSAMAPARIPFFTDKKSAQLAVEKYRKSTMQEQYQQDKSTFYGIPKPETQFLSPPYMSIYKVGDDVRQDQLVVHTIALMDEILKREHLDLKLKPYRVMATNMLDSSNRYTKCGFIEMVPSESVQDVLKNNKRSIRNWLKEIAPASPDSSSGTGLSSGNSGSGSGCGIDGIDPEVMDTYVRSCAGYCVITYLLGVGDRHLENLLLTKNGHLYHIDFSFILDQDPKPFSPPMKLNRDMVEGMGYYVGGNVESEQYKKFKSFCFDAFTALRRSANLILSLFNLMIHSNIPDICLEPDKTVKKIQDKFCLHMSDMEATSHLQMLIDQSVRALFPDLMDKLHEIAVGIKK
ncbi:phosphatidylinositol 3-kinase catalytic subunit type 3-like [Convolutriloba macropyga]|uniref:phosphatidylinositol 3-kinase catalytic subunit type 3-like n=1 Tax=Convolutriloba macropyga TaxID=536237 RepID=UPI003F5212A0